MESDWRQLAFECRQKRSRLALARPFVDRLEAWRKQQLKIQAELI